MKRKSGAAVLSALFTIQAAHAQQTTLEYLLDIQVAIALQESTSDLVEHFPRDDSFSYQESLGVPNLHSFFKSESPYGEFTVQFIDRDGDLVPSKGDDVHYRAQISITYPDYDRIRGSQGYLEKFVNFLVYIESDRRNQVYGAPIIMTEIVGPSGFQELNKQEHDLLSSLRNYALQQLTEN